MKRMQCPDERSFGERDVWANLGPVRWGNSKLRHIGGDLGCLQRRKVRCPPERTELAPTPLLKLGNQRSQGLFLLVSFERVLFRVQPEFLDHSPLGRHSSSQLNEG